VSVHLASLAVVVFSVAMQPVLAVDRSTRPQDWKLSFEGFGPARIGSTVREAAKALNIALHEGGGSGGSDPAECHYASNERALPGVGFMVIKGKIVRVDVFKGAYEATGGLRIGATEAEIKKRYPNIKTEPHHYDPNGHYLRLTSPDRAYGLVVETDGNRATQFRVGTTRAIALVEGCS